MIKLLLMLMLGYIVFRFINQVILSITGSDSVKNTHNGPSGAREKDISDKSRIIKD